MQGCLQKRSPKSLVWKKRYFVIKNEPVAVEKLFAVFMKHIVYNGIPDKYEQLNRKLFETIALASIKGSGLMFYYANEQDFISGQMPLDILNLGDIEEALKTRTMTKSHVLLIKTGYRTVYLAADSKQSLQEWHNAIKDTCMSTKEVAAIKESVEYQQVYARLVSKELYRDIVNAAVDFSVVVSNSDQSRWSGLSSIKPDESEATNQTTMLNDYTIYDQDQACIVDSEYEKSGTQPTVEHGDYMTATLINLEDTSMEITDIPSDDTFIERINTSDLGSIPSPIWYEEITASDIDDPSNTGFCHDFCCCDDDSWWSMCRGCNCVDGDIIVDETQKYVVRDDSFVLKGWLMKRSDYLKKWNRRYVVLFEQRLCYFRPSSKEVDIFDVEFEFDAADISVEPQEYPDMPFAFQINFGKTEHVVFGASTKDEQQIWMHSFDQLKNFV